MSQKFLTDIELEAGLKDNSNGLGTSGQVLSSTGSGVSWIDQSGGTSGVLSITVKNISGGTLAAGTAVSVATPSQNPPAGIVVEVIAADYDNVDDMPAIGILKEDLNDDAEGEAVMMGSVSSINTNSFNISDELYVGADGALVNSKPTTAGQFIQKIAVVVKKHSSNGVIKVIGAGRSNDVPLPLYIDNTNQRVGISEPSPSSKLEIVDDLSAASTAEYPLTLSVKDDNNSINQIGGEGVGIKFKIAGNDATDPGNSFVGAGIAAVREVTSDTDSSTGLAFSISQNDETLDEAVRISNEGYLGVGTNNPTRLLHLKADSSLAIMTIQRGNAVGGAFGALQWANLNNYSVASISAYTDGNDEGAHLYFRTTSDAANNDPYSDTNLPIRMTIRSTGKVGINKTDPAFMLDVGGMVAADQGMFSRKGIYTDTSYANQWQRVFEIPYPNAYKYGGLKLLVTQSGDTSNVNMNAEVHINYKFQANNGRININIINFGELPLTKDDFEVYRDGTNAKIVFYHKVTRNYTRPFYTVLNYSKDVNINWLNDSVANSIVGTSLSGETNDSFTEKNKYNSITARAESGRVGINETNPNESLHITGSVDNDDVAIRIQNESDDNSATTPPSTAVLFQTASNNGHVRVFGAPADTAANHKMDIGSTAANSYLTFSPSGSEKMRITSEGYVGIGTETPDYKLQIKTPQEPTHPISFAFDISRENSEDRGISMGMATDDSYGVIGTHNANLQLGHTFNTQSSGNPQPIFYPTMTVKHVDETVGMVGIGTTDPDKMLELSKDYGATIRIKSTKDGTWTVGQRLGGIDFYGSDASTPGAGVKGYIDLVSENTFGSIFNMSFGVAASDGTVSETLRINYDKKVGIGISDPISKLHIYENTTNTSTGAGLTIEQDGAGDALAQFLLTSERRWVVGIDNSDADKFKIASNADLNTNAELTIDINGQVGIGTTSPDTLLNIEGLKNQAILTLGSTTNDSNWSVGDKIGGINFYSADPSPGSSAGVKASLSYEVSAGSTGNTLAMVFRAAGTGVGENNIERMRIDSSGVVQVRNQTPTIQLYNTDDSLGFNQVIGDIDFYQSDPSGTGVGVVSKIRSVNLSSFQGQAGLAFHTGTANALTERMRITSGGHIEIGTKNYVYGNTNYHIALKHDDAANSSLPSDVTGYITNVNGTVLLTAGGYYYGANLRQLNAENTTYGGIRISREGVFQVESLAGGTGGTTATATTKFQVAADGDTISYGDYIRCQYSSTYYSQMEANSAGGVLKAVGNNVVNVMFRGYVGSSNDNYVVGKFGVATSTPDAQFEVAGDSILDKKRIVRLPGFSMGGGSVTDEYLVIAKKVVSGTHNATGLIGKIMFSRGGTSAGNNPSEYNVQIQCAYNNNDLNLLTYTGHPIFSSLDEIAIDGTTYYALKVRSSGGGQTSFRMYAEGIILDNGDDNILSRVRSSDSNVTVGTTGIMTPQNIENDGNSVRFVNLRAQTYYDSSGTTYYLDLAGTADSLRVAGDIVAFYSSDKRYKENIKLIESPIEKVKAIRGVNFKWNEKSHKETGKKDIGVIAQEVEEVLPEIVQTRENGYKAVDYQKLTAVLIEAVKDQQKQIDELKSIVNGGS